jgi:zincin-like metallopeptidase toxin 3 of polymorphic toxin system
MLASAQRERTVILPKSQRRYLKFTNWVQWHAPRLAHDRAVLDTMHDLVGIEPSRVSAALRWNHGPTISIVRDLDCRGRAAGCFRHAAPKQLEIDENIVEAYHKGIEKESRFTGSHRVPKAGIVVLHELVHWADFLVNGGRTSVGAPYHDIGSKWEWLVFATFLPDMAND